MHFGLVVEGNILFLLFLALHDQISTYLIDAYNAMLL